MACPICKMRAELEALTAAQSAERIALNACWINGGVVNNTDETTVITIDAPISAEHKSRLMALLIEIEQEMNGVRCERI